MFFSKSSFATGDLFGAKADNAKKNDKFKETVETTNQEKLDIDLTISSESENEETTVVEHHIYRYLDRKTGVFHDTNDPASIPKDVPFWKII